MSIVRLDAEAVHKINTYLEAAKVQYKDNEEKIAYYTEKRKRLVELDKKMFKSEIDDLNTALLLLSSIKSNYTKAFDTIGTLYNKTKEIRGIIE